LTGCGGTDEGLNRGIAYQGDTAAVVFGPSLTELFFVAGVSSRLAAVDRYSIWPPELQNIPRAGDFMTPSLERIAELGATSIHVVGNNGSLNELAQELGIPCYRYSFDRLGDIYSSCEAIEELYPEADLDGFRSSVERTIDSLAFINRDNRLQVMIVVYLEQDGAITLAGRNTFFGDVVEGIGCSVSAPETGSYPSVSVEGIFALSPDRVIILAPDSDPERVLSAWRQNGLDDTGVFVLTGDHLLIPGARLPRTIREIGSCLN